MDPKYLLTFALHFAPILLAGVIAGILALQCRTALKAFVTAFLGTILLAAAFAAAAERLSLRSADGAPVSQSWLHHLRLSPILALPLGVACAFWVANRTPPTINQ